MSGRYSPIWNEIAVDHLDVEGDLPAASLRNGPNPKYPPLGSYVYPLEADATIHGIWLDGGTARYANRFVRTAGLRKGEQAGRALFGGLKTPSAPDPTVFGKDRDPGAPFTLNPSFHVVRHAGRYRAMAEGLPPYEITAQLDTVGWCDGDGAIPAGRGAHPRSDPPAPPRATIAIRQRVPNGLDGSWLRASDREDQP